MKDILTALFGWIDRPWKALMVLVTLPLLGIGYLVWSERAILEQLLLRYAQEPSLLGDRAEDEARDLLRVADLVAIYSVDLPKNDQRGVVALTREGPVPRLAEIVVPFIAAHSGSVIVSDELAGRHHCWDVRRGVSAHLVWAASQGYVWVCALPIPGTGSVMVGLIHEMWKTQPTEAQQEEALAAGRAAALRLARW